MNQKNQSEVDSLLEQMEQGSTNVAVEQITEDDSASTEDTGESSSGQAEVSEGTETQAEAETANQPDFQEQEAPDPRGVPWVDFVPELTNKRPESVYEHLVEEQENLNDRLAEKELLKVSYLDQNAHKSYYKLWVTDSNNLFRSLVRVKYRKLSKKDDSELWEC